MRGETVPVAGNGVGKKGANPTLTLVSDLPLPPPAAAQLLGHQGRIAMGNAACCFVASLHVALNVREVCGRRPSLSFSLSRSREAEEEGDPSPPRTKPLAPR